MANKVRITVEDPDDIRNAGMYDTGALIRLQTSATEAGAFADVIGTGSTPTIAVVAATTLYLGKDPNGIVSSWYRTRYENAGGTRLSDWTPAFQVGDETAGLLCSLEDVKQRLWGTATTNVNQDEVLLDIIREVSADIESYVGAWLAPRPTNPASTKTLLFDVECDYTTRELVLSSEQRLVGIRTLTSMGVATTSQPESGGSYTAATVADVLLRPRPTADGPATRLVFNYPFTGPIGYFWPGYNTVSIVGSFGYAVVPYDIQAVAISAVTRRFIGKESAATIVSVGPDGGVQLLADLSPGMRATLARYRIPMVA